MTAHCRTTGLRATAAAAMAVVLAALNAPEAEAGPVYRLIATDVVIEQPAPLFSSDQVTGTITLADGIAPGMAFGPSGVTGLLLDFGGIVGTLADVRADIAPGPVQVFGQRSADGLSLAVLDLRFGFPPTVAGCSFVCAGQIVLNSPFGPDPSNFIAIDDPDANTLSILSFTPAFALIPEPASLVLLGAALAALGLVHGGSSRRQRARSSPSAKPVLIDDNRQAVCASLRFVPM